MFKIEFNPSVGRYLKALHDIEPGTVIIDEPSIVEGPCVDKSSSSSFCVGARGTCGSGNIGEPETNGNTYVCPVCYKKLPEIDVTVVRGRHTPETEEVNTRNEGPLHCPNCDLILCSPKCTASELHSHNECQIFKKVPALLQQVFKDPSKRSSLCQFITTVRCLFLRSTNPLKWNQLMQLQSNVKEFEEQGIFEEVDEGFRLLSWDLFCAESNQEGADADTADSIIQTAHICLGILRTNAFSQLTNEIGVERLYFFSSFMAHDCRMDTDRYFCAPDAATADTFCHEGAVSSGGRMITKSAIKIRQGESITTTYMSFLASTPERQNDMKRVWNFHCTCPRCVDPTECQTNLSTIECPNCSQVTLSAYFSLEDKACKWTCSNVKCKYGVSNEEDIQNILDKTVIPIEASRPALLTNVDETEQWLDTHDNGLSLHTNHSIFLQVKYFLCQYYGNEAGSGSDGLHELSNLKLLRKVRYCKETLNVLDMLFDGVYLFKGVVLFHLWLALKEVATRHPQEQEFEEIIQNDSTSKIAELAYEILRHGDPNSMEELMANALLCDDITLLHIH